MLKSWNLQQKYARPSVFDDLIKMANQCIQTFTYKKLILNVIWENGKQLQSSSSNFKATSWWKYLSKHIRTLESKFWSKIWELFRFHLCLRKFHALWLSCVKVDSILVVSFCVLRYDCHVRTRCGCNIRFPCKYEEYEKVEYVIFDTVFNYTCYL